MTYSATVLADSPVLYWRLGESSGSTAADTSGNGRAGTYSGSYTQGAAGLLTGDSDTAVVFSSGKVAIASASWMDFGTALTAEAWIKFNNKTNYREFMSRYTNSTTRAWEFRTEQSTGKAQFVKIAGGTATATGTTDLSDDVRHHCVATYDGSNIKLYVDKVLQATVATTGSISGAGEFHVGTRDAALDLTFAGTVDEVALYSTVLSATRIGAHYDDGTTAPPPPALTGTWGLVA